MSILSKTISTFFLQKVYCFQKLTPTHPIHTEKECPKEPNLEVVHWSSPLVGFCKFQDQKIKGFSLFIWYWRGGNTQRTKLCTAEGNKIELVNFCETYNNFPSRASRRYEHFMVWHLIMLKNIIIPLRAQLVNNNSSAPLVVLLSF